MFFNKLKALKLRCTTLWAVTDAVLRNLCSDSDEDTSEKSTDEDHQRSTVEDLTDVHFKFEVKEVCVCLALMSGHHATHEEGVRCGCPSVK